MSSRNESKYLLPIADKVIVVLIMLGLVLVIIQGNQEINKYFLKLGQQIGFPVPLILKLIILVLIVIISLKFIFRNYKKFKKYNIK
ncbi:MAG: hypothetical protein P9M11_04970 [Candidatus Tenebribacter burtonii]|jgi:hypothetical protein|nr:hypothetical protein [Candidatus Tenebribacter burtonii]